ncbi:hypothetical protein M8845_18580 [Gelidibacter japonicus]|uniref:hypothetical protein n=1 Tax=Gelidibacter japonicus TaxID=1962232 RepID=UPI0020220870|nr:hypothetical protein [Gelidibacter japonicus]MCL8009438.1 hypothetical protein [Gelidibacter japonicus]
MRKKLNIIIGITLIVLGLILKSLFNHNLEYWELIKNCSLILFALGLSVSLIPFWEKWNKKPKKNFKQKPTVWILFYGKNIFSLAFLLFVIIGLEKTGKNLNYNLRNYFLNSDSKITKGTIIDFVRIDITKAGSEDFYLIRFNNGQEFINKGLLIDYSDWDKSNLNKNFKITDNGIVVNKTKGGKIDIMYSEKFPSFIKIIE